MHKTNRKDPLTSRNPIKQTTNIFFQIHKESTGTHERLCCENPIRFTQQTGTLTDTEHGNPEIVVFKSWLLFIL